MEIGKYDLVENTPLNLSLLKKNCEFHGVSLDKFCNADTHHQKSVLALVREGISSGCVKPLERTCFNDQEIEKAYRIMAAGKHTGKMLIKIRDEEYERTIKVPENKFFGALPRCATNSFMLYQQEEMCLLKLLRQHKIEIATK